MQQILLVEDSLMFGKLTKRKIEEEFNLPVYWAKSFREAEELLEKERLVFSMALLDFNLPDAPHGEVIDRVVVEGISSIVFTANMSEEVRSHVWKKKVADYIIKEDPNCLEHVVAAMRQLEGNQDCLVLLVDDSPNFRKVVSELLYVRNFRVLNASDGKTALDILQQYPEIELVITDFNLPDMNGCILCQKIREKFKSEELAVLGFSTEEDRNLGARFIKTGADDFMLKESFLVEEFYSRVNRTIETVRLIEEIKERAIRDFLTGLYNRRHCFDAGNELLETCHRNGQAISCAILDIDFFKKVNDTHGHDVGDEAIKYFAKIMKDTAKEKDLIARIGGEEFCILIPESNKDSSYVQLEMLRQVIEQTPVASLPDGSNLFITCSIGCCLSSTLGLNEMMKVADENLYQAKEGGRNQVVIKEG
jgi:diguanylate cyclase (GGDEF)-like protein